MAAVRDGFGRSAVADGLLLWSVGRGFLDVGRFDDFQIAGFDVVLEADGVAYRCLFDGFGDGDDLQRFAYGWFWGCFLFKIMLNF